MLYAKGPTNENILDVYWCRVIAPPPSGSTWKFGKAGNMGPSITLRGLQTLVANEEKYPDKNTGIQITKKIPFHLAVTGAVEFEYTTDPKEPFPGPVTSQGGSSPSTDGVRASVTEQVSDVGAVSNPAIYDQTSAVNTALDAGIIDVTGWRWLSVFWNCSGGTSLVTVKSVDDANLDASTFLAPAASINGFAAIGPGVVASGQISAIAAIPLPRRVHPQAGAAGVGNTVRMRIEGRR